MHAAASASSLHDLRATHAGKPGVGLSDHQTQFHPHLDQNGPKAVPYKTEKNIQGSLGLSKRSKAHERTATVQEK